MKRIIAIILTLVLALSLTGCISRPVQSIGDEVVATTQSADTPASIDIHAALEQINLLVKDDEPMDIDADALTSLYGIEAAWCKDFACIATMGGVFASDILMFEAADDAAKENIKDALNTKLDDFLTQAQNYNKDSYALAKSCKVIEAGNYIALFLAPQHERMENIFLGK